MIFTKKFADIICFIFWVIELAFLCFDATFRNPREAVKKMGTCVSIMARKTKEDIYGLF